MDDENAKQGKPDEAGPKHKIYINDQEFEVKANNLSGAQIRAMAAVPAEYQLFLEQQQGDDRPIADGDSVKIHSNMKFYSLPPATFG